MGIKRIFIAMTAIFAASAVFADNSSVTSKKYVDDLMSGYQGKLPGSGANKLMIYDNSEDGIGEKAIAATLGNSASAVSVPTVGAVKTGLDGVQDTITGTAGYVMTGTGNPGEVGEKPIYSANTNYTDSLVTAETVNSGVINAVNSSLIRVDENGAPSDSGTLWEINTDLLALDVRGYLPDGYTALEYIQSSGSQYIDTGRVPNNDDIIEQKFQKVGTSTTTCSWYGSMPSSQTILPRIGIGSYKATGDASASIFGAPNYTGQIATVDTNMHTLRFQATGEKELTYTFDGVTDVIIASEITNMFEPAVELTSYLFARHGTNGVQVYDNEGTKIYYHREYLANGTLVLNMVPVKRNSDNVLGMYDLVSGQFFTNQGNGNFTAGPPVVGN